jgi:vitamin B12 transporter
MIRLSRLFFATLLCVNATFIYAQELLPEVKVITTKLPQKESQMAKSAIILGDSILRMHTGWSVTELLQKQVGISIVGASQTPGSNQSIFMRGGNAGHTLLLLDGIPLYDPSSPESNFDVNLINLENIERIEILKGGQSTLYGSDAVAGVINFISKKPESAKLKPSIKLSYGSFNTLNANVGLKGKLAQTSYTIEANTLHSNGFSSAVSDLSEPENDGFVKNNYLLKLDRNIGKLKANVSGSYTEYTSDLDAGAFLEDKDYTFESSNVQYGLGLDYEKEKFTIHLKASSAKVNRSFENDSSYVADGAYDIYSLSNFESTSNFADLYGNVILSPYVNLLVGTDFRNQSIAQTYFSIGEFGPFEDVPLSASQAKINNGSFYSALNLNTENGLGFELGGRYNIHSTYGSNFSYNVNPFWRVNNAFTVFGVYSTSFKNPSLYQLYSPYGNLDLIPESVESFDVGLKYENRESKTDVSVTLFDRKHKNKIGFLSLNTAPYGIYDNMDFQNAKGVELSYIKTIGDVSLNANYTYLQGAFGVTGEDEKVLLRRPKNQVNLSLAYALSERFNLSANYQFQSKRNDSFYDSQTYSTVDVILEPFHLLDVNLHYKISSSIRTFVSLNNMLNQSYTEIYGYNSAPINFKFGFVYH